MKTPSRTLALRRATAKYDKSVTKLTLTFRRSHGEVKIYDSIVKIAAENGLSTVELVRIVLKDYADSMPYG
jgi:hypothetical protein